MATAATDTSPITTGEVTAMLSEVLDEPLRRGGYTLRTVGRPFRNALEVSFANGQRFFVLVIDADQADAEDRPPADPSSRIEREE